MIDLLIYHLHLIGTVYAFTKRWQTDGMKAGLLAIAICALVFVILWSLTGQLARWIMPVTSAPGALFTADTLSLILVLIPESVFFWVFFLKGAGKREEAKADRQ